MIDSARRISAGKHEMELAALMNSSCRAAKDRIKRCMLQRPLVGNAMPAEQLRAGAIHGGAFIASLP